LADGYWAAHQGREALKVVWDEGPAVRFSTESMRRDMTALIQRPGFVAKKAGTGGLAKGGKQVSAVYEAPYLAHACMEPMNATAHVEADKCTMWVPTQYQCGPALGGGVQEVGAKIAGLDPSRGAVGARRWRRRSRGSIHRKWRCIPPSSAAGSGGGSCRTSWAKRWRPPRRRGRR